MTGRPPGGQYPFRVWRRRLGLTQVEAAKLLARSPQSISSYERMATLPRDVALSMLALEYLPSWRLAMVDVVPYWRELK